MVFARNPLSPLAAQAGVRFVLSRRELPLQLAMPPAEGFTIYSLPGATGARGAAGAPGVGGPLGGAGTKKAEDTEPSG